MIFIPKLEMFEVDKQWELKNAQEHVTVTLVVTALSLHLFLGTCGRFIIGRTTSIAANHNAIRGGDTCT